MLAFWISWHMSCAVSETSKVTWTDTLPQAHALYYHYICVTDPFLACKAMTSEGWGIKISVTGFKLLFFCRWMLTSIWLSVSLDFSFALTVEHAGQLVGTDLRTRTLGFTAFLPLQKYSYTAPAPLVLCPGTIAITMYICTAKHSTLYKKMLSK